MTINQRVKEYLDFKNVSYAELGRMIISKRGDVSSWFNEKSMVEIPPKKVLEIIKVYKDLNARWLITGEGEMLESNAMNPQIVAEPKVDYGDCMARLEAKAEECGRLKAVNQFLKEEISQLKGNSGREPVGGRARTG